MKTISKTFGFILLTIILSFSASVAFANNGHEEKKCADNDTTTESSTDPLGVDDGSFDFDFEYPFFFDDKVTVVVINPNDEVLYEKSLTRQELKADEKLRAILKQSDYMLSIDNQYYYLKK